MISFNVRKREKEKKRKREREKERVMISFDMRVCRRSRVVVRA